MGAARFIEELSHYVFRARGAADIPPADEKYRLNIGVGFWHFEVLNEWKATNWSFRAILKGKTRFIRCGCQKIELIF